MFRLIIVDDEERIVEGMADLFPWNNMGFEVAGKFQSAVKALEFLQDNHVDVVMTDVSMPEMDGVAFAKELSCYENLIVVFFSSYRDYHYMRSAILNQITDYLLKPIQYEDLVNCFVRIRERLESSGTAFSEENASYYDKIVCCVNHYMQGNLRTATLSKAAEAVGLSSNYLSRVYKEKSGVGFLEKLNQLRMEKACELLNNPGVKTYEIAYYVGYNNPKNFTRAFKAYYKVSPRDFRNGIRGDLPQ